MTEKIKKFMKSRTAGTVGLVLLLAVVIGLTVFGAVAIIGSRSNGSDDYATVQKLLNGSVLSDYAEKRIKKDISPYEDYSSAVSYVKNELDGKKTVECDAEGNFHVLIDGVKRFDVTVVSSLYGRRAQITAMYFSEPVYVEVPTGSSLTVGGKAVTDGEEVPYRFLSEYEQSDSSVYTSQRYYLGEFFGQPDIYGEYEGITLISPVLTDGTVCYPYPTEVTNDIVLTLPVGTEVIVNGKKVTDTSSNVLVVYPFLSRFEEGTSDILTSYEIDLGRFFNEPEIEAYYYGKKIEPKENTRLYPLPDGNDGSEYIITAPSDCTVKINGVTAGQTEVVSKRTYPLFDYDFDSTDDEGNAKKITLPEKYSFDYTPTQTVYKVSGLYYEPEIKCYTADGTECAVYADFSDEYDITFVSPDSYELTSAMKKALKKYCEYLCKYVLEASSSTSTYYNGLRNTSVRSSPSYIRVQQMWKTREYVCKIKKFGTIEYTNLCKLSDSKFAVTASVPYFHTSGKTTLEDVIKIEVLFSVSGSSIMFINFNILEETVK